MRMTYDRAVDALAIELVPGASHVRTVPIASGILAHFDAGRRFVELEVLQATDHWPQRELEQLDSPAVCLTLTDAARESRIGRATLRRRLQEGRLPGRKAGRAWRVSRAALWTYLESVEGVAH